jgi:protein dithiol oxidoreductase (disulfide-forming)
VSPTRRSIVVALFLAPFTAQAQSPAPGKDYVEIPNGRPLDPGEGQVVVEEFFNYACPGCNGFEPRFLAWTKQLPPYVRLDHVPAAFRADFVQYARAYYAAQALGVADEAHQAVYDGIHRTRTLPGEGQKPDEARIAKFYADFGVDADEFLAAMQSFGVNVKVRRATEHMQRIKIPETPSIVVNGRYLVRGESVDDLLRNASALIEQEHGRGVSR